MSAPVPPRNCHPERSDSRTLRIAQPKDLLFAGVATNASGIRDALTCIRYLKFIFVGAIGMAVQLASLAVLLRLMPHHYVAASAIAVELAILHNFLWHIHYTWRDRSHSASFLSQLLRFHASNGLVSLAGNLLLVRLQVQYDTPVMPANLMAIVCCSFANFALSHRWVFTRSENTVLNLPIGKSMTLKALRPNSDPPPHKSSAS